MVLTARSVALATPLILSAALTLQGCTENAAATARGDTPAGMVWIPASTFAMGDDGPHADAAEHPVHEVRLNGFWLDATEVTNARFHAFVQATGHVTTAERAPDLADLRAQLPPGAEIPTALSTPGSLVFRIPDDPGNAEDWWSWWEWTPGANWRHPEGPGSSIEGRDDHPVVQVSHDDAAAYARWAGKRLPTEAEWECAARGGLARAPFVWGDERNPDGRCAANIWQGAFPAENTRADGHAGTAPVGSYSPNGHGLHDMAGNVWEWCADWFDASTYRSRATAGVAIDPRGPERPAVPMPERVLRGGSFLCSDVYCRGYRPSARMKASPDTGLCHTGFRCARSP